jgi:hypothetical protein
MPDPSPVRPPRNQVFLNPVLEDAFHRMFQPARLRVARSTGQWINIVGFILNILTWFQVSTYPTPNRFILNRFILNILTWFKVRTYPTPNPKP